MRLKQRVPLRPVLHLYCDHLSFTLYARYRNYFMALTTMSMFEMGGANFPEAQESAIQVNLPPEQAAEPIILMEFFDADPWWTCILLHSLYTLCNLVRRGHFNSDILR